MMAVTCGRALFTGALVKLTPLQMDTYAQAAATPDDSARAASPRTVGMVIQGKALFLNDFDQIG